MPSLVCETTASSPPALRTLLPGDAREEALLTHPCWHLPALLAPPLWSHHPLSLNASLRTALYERERAVGAATLSAESILLLLELLQEDGHVPCMLWHTATITAQETQSVLPPGVVVLKTVTVQLDRSLLLWTRLGHMSIARTDLRDIARTLGLSARVTKQCQINPRSIDPEEAYGMKEGMVSPFLRPLHQTQAHLVAIVSDLTLNTDRMASPYPEPFQVAISLSRYESLLVPGVLFPALLRTYARHAYPHLRFIERSSIDQGSAI